VLASVTPQVRPTENAHRYRQAEYHKQKPPPTADPARRRNFPPAHSMAIVSSPLRRSSGWPLREPADRHPATIPTTPTIDAAKCDRQRTGEATPESRMMSTAMSTVSIVLARLRLGAAPCPRLLRHFWRRRESLRATPSLNHRPKRGVTQRHRLNGDQVKVRPHGRLISMKSAYTRLTVDAPNSTVLEEIQGHHRLLKCEARPDYERGEWRCVSDAVEDRSSRATSTRKRNSRSTSSGN